MIAKSLLTALTLTILYTLFINAFRDHISRTGQTAAQRNIVKAEEYLYEVNERYDTVLVGSSMSERLITDSLPGKCYNLAMAGLSSLDGLALIKQTGHRPRLIYVELNTLARGQTSALLQAFNQPSRQFLNQHFPFLRQKYQPVSVAKSLLRDWQYGKTSVVFFGANAPVDTTFRNKAIQERLLTLQHIPPDSSLQASIDVAWTYLEAFRQRGVKIILFEMPTDQQLQTHRLTATVRQQLVSRFPASRYPVVQVPAEGYQTTDGVHLTPAESIRYTAYLRRHIDQLTAERLLTQSKSNGL